MWKYIRSIDKYLSFIFLISFSSVLLIDCWLIDIPAPHHIIERLGRFYYAVCLAYITSFVFHFVVVHMKNVKDKEFLDKYIAIQIQNIINTGIGFIYSLARYKSYELKAKYPEKQDIIYLFENTRYTEENPEMVDYKASRHLMWYETLLDMLNMHQETIIKIESRSSYVDAELLGIITELKDSSLVFVVHTYAIENSFSTQKMAQLSTFFYDYIKIIERLEVYFDKNYSKYKFKQI